MTEDDARREGPQNGEPLAPAALKKARERDKDRSREARLAEALRENLRRRKDAARKDRT